MSASDLDRLFCGRGEARAPLPHDQPAKAKTASAVSGWTFIANRDYSRLLEYLPSVGPGEPATREYYPPAEHIRTYPIESSPDKSPNRTCAFSRFYFSDLGVNQDL